MVSNSEGAVCSAKREVCAVSLACALSGSPVFVTSATIQPSTSLEDNTPAQSCSSNLRSGSSPAAWALDAACSAALARAFLSSSVTTSVPALNTCKRTCHEGRQQNKDVAWLLLMQPDLEMPRFGKDTTTAVELNGEPAPKGIQNCADLALIAW